MRSYYAQWLAEVKPLQEQVNYISVGVESEPTAMLCSANWIGSYADSWENIGGSEVKNGYWDLQVEKSGKYKIELYGWPKQAGKGFGDTLVNVQGRFPGREVAKAKLKLGDDVLTAQTSPRAMSVVFEVALSKGDRRRLQSWLYDKEGKELGGAYFAYVTKL